MMAPIPKAVSDHAPRDFFSRFSGFSASEISLSMDFFANSWLDLFANTSLDLLEGASLAK
jgi:hypothetical protein